MYWTWSLLRQSQGVNSCENWLCQDLFPVIRSGNGDWGETCQANLSLMRVVSLQPVGPYSCCGQGLLSARGAEPVRGAAPANGLLPALPGKRAEHLSPCHCLSRSFYVVLLHVSSRASRSQAFLRRWRVALY